MYDSRMREEMVESVFVASSLTASLQSDGALSVGTTAIQTSTVTCTRTRWKELLEFALAGLARTCLDPGGAMNAGRAVSDHQPQTASMLHPTLRLLFCMSCARCAMWTCSPYFIERLWHDPW